MIKKKKNSKKASGRRIKSINYEEVEAIQVEIQHSACSIMNLPNHILTAILFRLPIKEIIICKCTCKSLYATISDPEFAKLHYAQSEVFPIARIVSSTYVSRIVYLLQLEQDEYYSECLKFDSKLKIPLRNFPLVAKDDHNNYKAANSRNRFLCLSEPYHTTPFATCNEDMINNMITLMQTSTNDRNCKVNQLKNEDHGYKVVNSCNGFLCLSGPSRIKLLFVVCNPVTGEFINLPQLRKSSSDDYYCGFGFSPKTNQYKVVKMYGTLAQVHILGSGSWKNIEFGPYLSYTLEFPTYLNGVVHWFCFLGMKLSLMVSFDCEKECFLPFSLPDPLTNANMDNVGMGVLGGCLCLCDSSNQSLVRVWVMKNCGVEKSWTQLFEIDMMTCSDRPLSGSYQPIKYMKNGAVLMFNYRESVLVLYDSTKSGLKLFEFRHIESKCEIVAHTPSFISLEDVLAGCNVEVLNVYSRCGGLKIYGEAGAIYLYGKMNL